MKLIKNTTVERKVIIFEVKLDAFHDNELVFIFF